MDSDERFRAEVLSGWRPVPAVGRVVAQRGGVPPYVVVDDHDVEVEAVSGYLLDRTLGDVSRLTVRSYAFDLLRWFRLLWLLGVRWDRATEAETAVLVGNLRSVDNPQRRRTRVGSPASGPVNARTGKAEPASDYAPATVAHVLSVVFGFYDFHMHFGRGPVVNPVPESPTRRTALAHRSPLEPARRFRRSGLRPKLPAREPRSIPDVLVEELFEQLRNDRDRALVAFYLSSGARASELLSVGCEDVDWGKQRIWVISKGSRARQWAVSRILDSSSGC